jgi:hypothetical protein
MDAVVNFIQDVEQVLLTVAGSLAVIGVIGVAAMYLLSPWPVFADWKANNPKAFSTVVTGLVLMIFAGGGGVALVLGF